MTLNTPSKLASRTGPRQSLLLARPGFADTLSRELIERFGIESTVVHPAAVAVAESVALPHVSDTVFARQSLPLAVGIEGKTASDAAAYIIERLKILSKRSNRKSLPWTLHAFSSDDDAGLQLASKVAGAVKEGIKSKAQDVHKLYFADECPAGETSPLIVQVWGASGSLVYVSLATTANGVVPTPGGVQRMKKIHGAPSRSSSKLEEALRFLNLEPKAGETGVDLGAAPGGWTFVMALHGVDMIAIDHAELDLPKNKKISGQIRHLKENGVKYLPEKSVDWLCCDMVMGARQSLEVLDQWLKADLMRHFVVNIKLPQDKPWPAVEAALALLSANQNKCGWKKLQARHLFHDRHEITLIGSK